jgi:hypothetical protein
MWERKGGKDLKKKKRRVLVICILPTQNQGFNQLFKLDFPI